MQNDIFFEKPPISGTKLLAINLILITFYIVISTLVALPMKYIFIDYFTRMEYIDNVSYLTVIMALMTAKFAFSFLRFNVKMLNASIKS
jgi:hypothetical protein